MHSLSNTNYLVLFIRFHTLNGFQVLLTPIVLFVQVLQSHNIGLHTVKMVKQFYLNIYGILTGTTTLGQSGSGNNGNEGVLDIPKALELEPHHQMV